MPILPMRAYRHTRTGNLYRVLFLGLAKIGNGAWVPSVIYVSMSEADNNEVFTRDVENFRMNFEAA